MAEFGFEFGCKLDKGCRLDVGVRLLDLLRGVLNIPKAADILELPGGSKEPERPRVPDEANFGNLDFRCIDDGWAGWPIMSDDL